MACIKPPYARPRSHSSALCVLGLDSAIKSCQTYHDCTFHVIITHVFSAFSATDADDNVPLGSFLNNSNISREGQYSKYDYFLLRPIHNATET